MFCKKGKRYSLNRRAAIGEARKKGVWVSYMMCVEYIAYAGW